MNDFTACRPDFEVQFITNAESIIIPRKDIDTIYCCMFLKFSHVVLSQLKYFYHAYAYVFLFFILAHQMIQKYEVEKQNKFLFIPTHFDRIEKSITNNNDNNIYENSWMFSKKIKSKMFSLNEIMLGFLRKTEIERGKQENSSFYWIRKKENQNKINNK